MITNQDIRRRIGRMEQSYSLATPYGSLEIRPIVSNGAVSNFDPISAVYCPSTEKIYCGNADRFIYSLNPKKTESVEGANPSILHDDSVEYSVTTEYDSEYIPSAVSANGSMHKATSFTNSSFSGNVEVKFSISIDTSASYYYGYKISKNNSSSSLTLENVISEGCYDASIDKSINRNKPKNISDLFSYTSYAVTVNVDAGDSVEIWVGGAMKNCASSGGSATLTQSTVKVKNFSARALYDGALEESIQWRGTKDFTRKDYIGNFTSYENKYYIDGAYSPINERIYYAFGSKQLYENLNGGFGIAKLNPHTNIIEKEINLYNFDPVLGEIYPDASLSSMQDSLPTPSKLIYCPTNNKIYVLHGNPVKSWLTVIDPVTDKILGSFSHSSFKNSSDIEYSPLNDRIYITNSAGFSISVINPHTQSSTTTISEFAIDGPTALLLHLNNDFFDSQISSGEVSVKLNDGSLLKDYELSTGREIKYGESFSYDPNEETARKIQTLPTDAYSKRWKEKNFNNRQYNRAHTIFDGGSCQKIPYRADFGLAEDEFTIEFWINPDKNYFQTKRVYDSSTGTWDYQSYNADTESSKINSGDGSTMLLFSLGNTHSTAVTRGGLGAVLNQGVSYDDPLRGTLDIFCNDNEEVRRISPSEEENKIKFGEWNHIAVVRDPKHTLSGDDFTYSTKLNIYVNGIKWADFDTDFEINETTSPYLYIGGTKGSKLLKRISSIDYSTEELTTGDLHELQTGDAVNIYSRSGDYPIGLDEFRTFYVKKISDYKLTLYLNKEDAISAAVLPPINLEVLSNGDLSDFFISQPQKTADDWMHYSGLMNGFRFSDVVRYERNFRPHRFIDFDENDEETILLLSGGEQARARNITLDLESVGVLETTSSNTTATDVTWPGASFQLPFGWNNKDMISFKDRSGKFSFKDGKEFSITCEANFIAPDKLDPAYAGIHQPISLAYYESDDGKIIYEFLVSKLSHNMAANGSGLYFKQYNEGVLVVDMYKYIYDGTLGNNKWHTFSLSRDSSGKYSMSHNGALLEENSPSLTVYPSSSSDQGKFKIGRGDWEKVIAVSKVDVSSGAVQILKLDPHIGYPGNTLGYAYSDQKSLSGNGSPFKEIQDIEIISLGETQIASEVIEDASWKPIKDSSGAVLTALTGNSRLNKHKAKNGLNRGVALFKGDHSPSSSDLNSIRLKSSGSYIKHLPKEIYKPDNTHTWGYMNEHSQNAFFGNNNFSVECSIMPMDFDSINSTSDIASEMGLICFNYDDLDSSSIDWSDCPWYQIHSSDAVDGVSSCADANGVRDRLNGAGGIIWTDPWQSGGSNAGKVGWELKINSAGKIEFNFGSQARNTMPGDINHYYNGTARNITSTSTLKYSDWYTVTVSRIGANIYLYINGIQEASINIGEEHVLEHPLMLGLENYDKMGLLIGKSYNGVTVSASTPYYFEGLMDELRIRTPNGSAQHTPYFKGDLELNKTRKSVIDTSLNKNFSTTRDLGHATLENNFYSSADYLYLNFNNSLKNKISYVSNTDSGVNNKSPFDENFSIEEEGAIRIRENDEEGLIRVDESGSLVIAGSSKFNLGSEFTIEGWFYNTKSDTSLVRRTNSNGGGWDLKLNFIGGELAPKQVTLNIYDTNGAEYKTITADLPGDMFDESEWSHFAIQIEDSTKVSLIFNGICFTYETITATEFAHTNLGSNQQIVIGEGGGHFDDFRISNQANYSNHKKLTDPKGKIELVKEPDIFHLNKNNLYYGKHSSSDHSLKLKSDYGNGDLAYLSVDGTDFNFGSEDFTVEFYFRCDSLSELPIGTSVLVGKGNPTSSDHTFYIGLETESVGSDRKTRLVAESGGVKLLAKENDKLDGNAPGPLYFYDLNYFHSSGKTVGHDHEEEDYIIQKYKHVTLCKHTYAGVSYLSLFVDKRMVASNFEISTYDLVSNNHTYTTDSLSSSASTSYPLTIGTGVSSDGVIGTFFSGNISLIRIERGTNPNLSTAYRDWTFRGVLEASQVGSFHDYSASGNPLMENQLRNSYLKDYIAWSTGIKWALGNFETRTRADNHGIANVQLQEQAHDGYYPEMDAWYFQSNILGSSTASSLDLPGGTELFIDFREGIKDLSLNSRTISKIAVRDGVADATDTSTKTMQTPPTCESVAYFGGVSSTSIHKDHTSAEGNDYILIDDPKNKWNYFDQDFVISLWVKPEDLSVSPVLFSRSFSDSNKSGSMKLSVTSSGNLKFYRNYFDGNQDQILNVESASPVISENEWTHVQIVRRDNDWDLLINGAVVTKLISGDLSNTPNFTGTNSSIACVGRDQSATSIADPDVVMKSLRFNGSDSPILTRTPTVSGSQRIFTFSTWVKRSDLDAWASAYETIWASEASASYVMLAFYQDRLRFQSHGAGETPTLQSDAVFTDVAAWYHIVLSVDTNQAIQTDRVKIYVNGSEISLSPDSAYTDMSLGYDLQVNTPLYTNKIGYSAGTSQYFDGYLAGVTFIDGTALTPGDFAEENTTTGQWKPKATRGLTFGTNGFHLPFENDTDIGNDVSGNNNDFSVAAGLSTWDVVGDSPVKNYCVWNPLDPKGSNGTTFSEGNLKGAFGNTTSIAGTVSATGSGKYYCEILFQAETCDASDCNRLGLGIVNPAIRSVDNTGYSVGNGAIAEGGSVAVFAYAGQVFNNAAGVIPPNINYLDQNAGSAYASIAVGDIVQIAMDLDAGTVKFGVNDTWYNDTATSTFALAQTISIDATKDWTWFSGGQGATSDTVVLNAGQDPFFAGNKTSGQDSSQSEFFYKPPSGFVSLSTASVFDYHQFKGHIGEFIIADKLPTDSSAHLKINEGGAKILSPSSIKLLLNFNDLEDHSSSVERNKPKSNENTVLLLPFDGDLNDKSGQVVAAGGARSLSHYKYEATYAPLDCVQPPHCNEIGMSGTYWNSEYYNGTYTLEPDTFNGKPVWLDATGDKYIYYGPDMQYGGPDGWHFAGALGALSSLTLSNTDCPASSSGLVWPSGNVMTWGPSCSTGSIRWTNKKKIAPALSQDQQTGSVTGFWEISGDVNSEIVASSGCPIIDNIDKILGAGSGKYDGTCYSIFEDVEDWDLANEDFTIEFWYKKSEDSTPSNVAPFAANGTCIIARQGYGFSKESLSWGVELSYVEEDLGTAFFSWRQQGRIDKTIKNLNLQGSPSVLQNSFLPSWSSLGVSSSPEMRFYFCVDNGTTTPPASGAWANITDPGVDGKKMATFTLTLGSPSNDVWEHYAIVRKENEFKTYKNGKLIDSMGEGEVVTRHGEGDGYAWNGFNIKAPANNPVLAIGADTRFINNNWYLKGNLDEIRISKGAARYLEDFEIETVKIDESAVESTITTGDKTAAITYCPPSKALYAFTFDSGISYSIDPMTNTITYAYQFSDSETERVKESYFCPINNSILISSYDGVYRIYSFLPKTGSIDRAFSVYDEGKFAYAPTMNKMYYVGRNYAYEIGD